MSEPDNSYISTFEDCENRAMLLQEIASVYPYGSPEEDSIRYAAFAIFHMSLDQSTEAHITARRNSEFSLTGREILMLLSSGYKLPKDLCRHCDDHIENKIQNIVDKNNNLFRKKQGN